MTEIDALKYDLQKSEDAFKKLHKKYITLLKQQGGLERENKQLKQDKKRLIGFLHRYKGVDVEDIDEVVLSKEYLDEWGELYDDER